MTDHSDERLPPDAKAFSRLIRRSRTLLESLTETLADLLEQVEAQKGSALKPLTLKASELQSALKRAEEIEGQYHDWHANRSRTLRPGDYDLDAARAEVERRLDQLRGALGAGPADGGAG
ncbi:hypothetical protein [Histidinibacterium aquaticum]|uniref:Uncharacterized protein n=1 Tax=Histidinibacterium aquaticum TaxID=2613962 RepID=A0A5J5GLL9_9RHOB|nr:hypothetical protein [Histidinibacterium aquaticum]KAA9009246.1 hypothetical protein F3S47_08310 [Histidinibacterium aquaticum]